MQCVLSGCFVLFGLGWTFHWAVSMTGQRVLWEYIKYLLCLGKDRSSSPPPPLYQEVMRYDTHTRLLFMKSQFQKAKKRPFEREPQHHQRGTLPVKADTLVELVDGFPYKSRILDFFTYHLLLEIVSYFCFSQWQRKLCTLVCMCMCEDEDWKTYCRALFFFS